MSHMTLNKQKVVAEIEHYPLPGSSVDVDDETLDSIPNNAVFKTLQTTLKDREQFKENFPITFPIVVLMGLAFGWFLHKGGVYDPRNIRGQYDYTRFVMLKLFCGAGGTSCILFAIAYKYCRNHWEIARSKYRGVNNLTAALVGGSMLGAGMAVAGSCPGMIWAQLFTVERAWVALLGAFMGAFIYGVIDPWLKPYISTPHIPDFVDEKLTQYASYPMLASGCAAGFYLLGIVLELIFDWTDDKPSSLPDNCSFVFDCVSWVPFCSGIGIGLLQIPCLWLGNTLGTTSMYTAVTGQWLRCLSEEKQNQWCHIKAQLNRWWQVAFVMTAAIGGYLSAVAAAHGWDIVAVNAPGVSSQFIGGFMMVFGSRMAKGCTSGHGLSGTALMCSNSFITVGAMFFGGAVAMACWGRFG